MKKLVGSANEWRIRIGEYRIIYEINDRADVITVLNVDKRSDVYK
jgi:mRNA interferase RelE/StbE